MFRVINLFSSFRDAAKERVQYVINEVRLVHCYFLQKQLHNLFVQKSRSSKEKVQIDAVFFRRIMAILKIIIPGIFSPEMGYVLLVAGALVTRSVCDIWMSQNATSIERLVLILLSYKFMLIKIVIIYSSIIGQSLPLFKKNLTSFVVAMPLVSSF